MDKYYEQFESYHKTLMEEPDKFAKFSRNKLFNINAMKRIVAENPLLDEEYTKLQEKGKEIFGYHYNEIILSFIFMKHVINDEEVFAKYKKYRVEEIRKANEKTIKTLDPDDRADFAAKFNPDEKSLEEMDTASMFGTPSGFPSTPYMFKDSDFLRKSQKASGEAAKTKTQVMRRPIGLGTFIEPNPNVHDAGVNSYKIKNEQTKMEENYEINSLIDGELLLKEMEHTFKTIDGKQSKEIFDKMQEKGLGQTTQPLNPRLRNGMIEYILNNSKFSNRMELNSISDEVLEGTYNNLKAIIEKYTRLNEDTSKHPALTKLDRLHKDNEKNESDYFKTLNKGQQDMVKDGNDNEEGITFEYDFDKDSVKKEDSPNFKQDQEPLAKFVALNRGRGAEDLDYTMDPGKKYWDRIKSEMGEEKFNLMKEKARLRKLEKENQRNVKTQIQDIPEKDLMPIQEGKTRKEGESDKLKGGKGDKLSEKDVNKKELEMGIKDEMEHTNDKNIAKEIALDHLAKDPKHYTNLKKVHVDEALDSKTKAEIEKEQEEIVKAKMDAKEKAEQKYGVKTEEKEIMEESSIVGIYKNIINESKAVNFKDSNVKLVEEVDTNVYTKIKTEGLGNSYKGTIENKNFGDLTENKKNINNFVYYINESTNEIVKTKKEKINIDKNFLKSYKKSVYFNIKN